MSKKILLTNDDGIKSPGLQILKENLENEGFIVFTCAPENNRSGCSHAISISKEKLLVKKLKENVYTIMDANPVDCVKVFLKGIAKEPIDIVVSGINLGPNLGYDIYYSGTVGAAREANINGIPSIAISYNPWNGKNFIVEEKNLVSIAQVIPEIIKGIFPYLNPTFLLSLNFPYGSIYSIKGVEYRYIGGRFFDEQVVVECNNDGMLEARYIGEPPLSYDNIPDWSDTAAEKNYILSITAIPLSNHPNIINNTHKIGENITKIIENIIYQKLGKL